MDTPTDSSDSGFVIINQGPKLTMADPVVFVSEPSQHFTCPVCHKLYTEPVINVSCGHTYCKLCSQNINTCPLDRKACDQSMMVVNRLVVGQIDDLLIFCKYGLMKENDHHVPDPTGCKQQIQLGARSKHEEQCEFMQVSCPNNNCTARCRRCEMEEHRKTCTFNKCTHENKGCEFEGQREEVLMHETTCGYRALPRPQDNSAIQEKTEQLEAVNTELQKQVSTLNMRVGQLEESNTLLQGQLSECLRSLRDLKQSNDQISASMDQLMAVKNRRSYSSPGAGGEGRPRSASSSSARYSVSGSPPTSVRLEKWNMPFQFKCIGTLRGHQNIVWCMASRNKKLYTAGADCNIKVWDLENLHKGCIKTISGHSKAIQCMCIGGGHLYTGGHDNTIRCWNLDDHSIVKSVENAHDNIICAMAIAADFLFTASFSLIKVWEAKTLVQKHTIPGLHHWVRSLALNPDRDKLYSGSHNTIDIWSVNEPFSLKGKVDHQFGSVYSLAITSKYIIAGTYNRNIHVFSLSTYDHVNALKGHIGVVNSLFVSPWTYNHNIQLFDGTSYEHVRELMGHIGMIHCIVPSLSGRFLFSSSIDKSIQIWNLENMLPIQTLQRHEGSVNTLVVHGDFLFSGSEDTEIKVFMYFQMQMGFAVNT